MFGFNLETLSPGCGMMGGKGERLFQLGGMYDDHLFQLPDHFRGGQIFKDVIKGHWPNAS